MDQDSYIGAKLIRDGVIYLSNAKAIQKLDASQFLVTDAKVEREPTENVEYELTTGDGRLDQTVKLIEPPKGNSFLFAVTD